LNRSLGLFACVEAFQPGVLYQKKHPTDAVADTWWMAAGLIAHARPRNPARAFRVANPGICGE